MELFQQEGMFPDEFTFFKVLNACVVLQALEEGRLHPSQIIQSGCELDLYVGSTLIHM
jgi:hypothetical protein